MKSEKAKIYIMEHAEKDGDTCQYYIHESEAFEAVDIAEREIKQSAIEAYKCACIWRKKDKCSLVGKTGSYCPLKSKLKNPPSAN